MGAGNSLFYAGKKGRFHVLGLGFIGQKTEIENGNEIKISAIQLLRLWDLCIWNIGFSQNLGWKLGIQPPPPTENGLIVPPSL